MTSSADVRVTGPLPAPTATLLRQGWSERSLVAYFGRRFNEKRYLRTWLGAWWLLLRPGLTIGWQMFVFILIAPIDSGPVPFPVTFLVAFATWSFFAEGAFWATRSLELNRRALKVVAVSPLVVIVAALVPALIDLAICFGVLLATVIVYLAVAGHTYIVLSAGSVSIVAGYALLTMLALGVGFLLAVPGARFRDIRFGLRFILSIWYFVTPVIYPISAVSGSLRTLVEINPVSGPIELIRHGLLGTESPPALALISSVVLTAFVLAVGFRRFIRGHGKGLDHL